MVARNRRARPRHLAGGVPGAPDPPGPLLPVGWRVDPRRAAAFVALNPLVLVHVVGGAHNDSLLILALMGSVALLVTGRQVTGAVALAVAVGLKASGLLVAPFAVAGSRRRVPLAAA